MGTRTRTGIRNQGLGKKGNSPIPIPIIAMTAHAIAGDRENCLAAGMNGYIAKPIDPDALVKTLVQWIAPGHRDPAPPSHSDPGDDTVLPEFTVIDIAAGLRHMGGNRRLYVKLLKDFHTDHIRTADDIHAAIMARDPETAWRAVHTLKSVAGNIGAVSLHEAASALEQPLRGANLETARRLLPHLERAFEAVITALSLLTETVSIATEAFDPPKTRRILDRFRGLLVNGDSEVLDLVPSLQAILWPPDSALRVARLIRQTENIDFEDALKTLDVLCDSLDI